MRWVVFAVILYLVLVMQTAVAPFLVVQTIRPDFAALLAIHVILAAPLPDALLAAGITGVAVDLCSGSYHDFSNIGANTLAYGLVALMIVRLRKATFRDHAATYFIFVLLATTLIHLMVTAHVLYRAKQTGLMLHGVEVSVYTGIYTALLSPYAHWLLRRARGVLGIGPMQTLRVR